MLSLLSPYDLVAYGELEPFYEKICYWLNLQRKQLHQLCNNNLYISLEINFGLREKDANLFNNNHVRILKIMDQDIAILFLKLGSLNLDKYKK